MLKYVAEPAWVIRQTIERRRRELEEEDAEREQRLAAARAKEQDLVRLAERPRKRQVWMSRRARNMCLTFPTESRTPRTRRRR